MKKIITVCVALLTLSACSELELGSHIAKQMNTANKTPTKVGSFKVGSRYKIKGRTYKPKESYSHSETGIASWYGPGFHGKLTANGEIFDQNDLTAAHRTLQMPSIVRVTNLENGRSIIVRVNDRGPFAHDRIIDLSSKAADVLGMKHHGTARVRVDVMEQESRQVASAAKRGISTRGVEIALNRGQALHEDMQMAMVTPSAKPGGKTILIEEPTHIATAPEMIQPNAQPNMSFDDILIKQAHANTPSKKPLRPTQSAMAENIYVQTGSFSSHDNALTMKASLYNIQKPVQIDQTTSNGLSMYRVKIGPFSSTDEADTVMKTLSRQGREARVVIAQQ